MRYLILAAFVIGLAALLIAIETILRLSGAAISLTDTRGVGQVTLLAVSLGMLVVFVHFVIGVNPFQFLWHYMRRWRRAAAGFLVMALSILLLSAALFAIFLALGWATWSWPHWQALDAAIVAATLSALLVAVLLATVEELIFRATVLRYLRRRLDLDVTVTAIVVSAALFAVSHLIAFRDDPGDIVPLMVGLFLLGVVLATTYVVTGSLTCAIGVHFGLLGFKIILRKTQIGTFGGDVRTGADFYLLMICLTVGLVLLRRQLWQRFAIEPAALLEEDLRLKRISSF